MIATARGVLVVVLVGVALLVIGDFSGSVANPVASKDVASPVPNSSIDGCTVLPLTNEVLDDLAATPLVPRPPREPGLLPAGSPATTRERVIVSAVIDQFIACANSGDPRRVQALYTRSYAATLLAPTLGLAPERDDAATPRPASSADRTRLVAIDGVRRLPGERLGALVTIDYAVIPEPKRFFFTFRQEAGTWRIDDVLGELSFSLP